MAVACLAAIGTGAAVAHFAPPSVPEACAEDDYASDPNGQPIDVDVINVMPETVALEWVNPDGVAFSYGRLYPQRGVSMRLQSGSIWIIRDESGHCLSIVALMVTGTYQIRAGGVALVRPQ